MRPRRLEPTEQYFDSESYSHIARETAESAKPFPLAVYINSISVQIHGALGSWIPLTRISRPVTCWRYLVTMLTTSMPLHSGRLVSSSSPSMNPSKSSLSLTGASTVTV